MILQKISIFILKTLIHSSTGNLSRAMKQDKKNTVRKNRSQVIFIDDITEYVEKGNIKTWLKIVSSVIFL